MLRLLSLSSAIASALGAAQLLVHKQLITDLPMVFSTGTNFTVKIDVTNVGDSAAYDINVNDPWPAATQEGSEGFVLTAGEMEFAMEELAAGEVKSHEFTMIPFFEGAFDGVRAEIHYLAEAEGDVVKARSTNPGQMRVYSAENFLKYFATHTREWTIFYVASGSTVLAPLALWLLIQVKSPGGVPTGFSKSD